MRLWIGIKRGKSRNNKSSSSRQKRLLKMKKELQTTKDYKQFVNSLVQEINQARRKAYQTISRELVDLYLFFGKGIYEKIELSKWGEGIVETLSTDL